MVFYNGKTWYEYDDTKQKREHCNSEQIITPHLIFYVITNENQS